MTFDHKVEIPQRRPRKEEVPVPDIYPIIDSDLGRDNVENDIPAADLSELRTEKTI